MAVLFPSVHTQLPHSCLCLAWCLTGWIQMAILLLNCVLLWTLVYTCTSKEKMVLTELNFSLIVDKFHSNIKEQTSFDVMLLFCPFQVACSLFNIQISELTNERTVILHRAACSLAKLEILYCCCSLIGILSVEESEQGTSRG